MRSNNTDGPVSSNLPKITLRGMRDQLQAMPDDLTGPVADVRVMVLELLDALEREDGDELALTVSAMAGYVLANYQIHLQEKAPKGPGAN